MRLLAALLTATALALGAVGCGDSESQDAAATTAAPSTTAPTTETGGPDPLEGATTEPVIGKAQGTEIALLERVDIGRHEGYDRVVFEFRNVVPGYRVEYAEPPIRQDGSGEVVKVDGKAVVTVRMEPASSFDLNTGEGELTYKGPRRIKGASAGASVIDEAVQVGDFEAVLVWAIGLSERVDYRVTTLEHPARLVVDFRNH